MTTPMGVDDDASVAEVATATCGAWPRAAAGWSRTTTVTSGMTLDNRT